MNYVQVRFESRKQDKALGMILHNTRKVKPGYLKNNMAHNKESNTIYIKNNDSFDEYDITDKTIQTKINNKLKQQLKNEIESAKKDNKNFRANKCAVVQDSVITLSNSINKMYEEGAINKKKLNTLFLKSVKELEKEIGLKALNVSIHYDETTPHAHISFRNYYNGKSINNKLKKQYGKSQDIVGNVWQEIGFKRGEKKEITNAKHLSIVDMHKKVKEVEDLKKEKKEIVKKIIEIFNKNDNKGILKSFDKDRAKKDVYKYINEITKLQYIPQELKKIKDEFKSELITLNNTKIELEEELQKKESEIYRYEISNKVQEKEIIRLKSNDNIAKYEKLKEDLQTEKEINKNLQNTINDLANKYKHLKKDYEKQEEEKEAIRAQGQKLWDEYQVGFKEYKIMETKNKELENKVNELENKYENLDVKYKELKTHYLFGEMLEQYKNEDFTLEKCEIEDFNFEDKHIKYNNDFNINNCEMEYKNYCLEKCEQDGMYFENVPERFKDAEMAAAAIDKEDISDLPAIKNNIDIELINEANKILEQRRIDRK